MDLWWTLVEGAVFYDFYISSTNDVTPSNYEEKIIREAYHGGYTVLQSKPGECRSIIMVARNSYGESGSSNVSIPSYSGHLIQPIPATHSDFIRPPIPSIPATPEKVC